MITLDDGSVIDDELAVADAHPAGGRPFDRPAYTAIAQVLLDLGRRNQLLAERLAGTADGRDAGREAPRLPHEEIRDFFYRRQNYVHDTDLAAERLAEEIGVRPGEVVRALGARLTDRHGVRLAAETGERLHHYDEPSRTLFLSTRLRPGQRAFRMATQLALLEYGDELDRQAGEDFPPGSSAHDLARIGIANYCAAALILPYTAFHSAAEEVRYDIERLTDRYGLGYEIVCHRLSTLQRPRLRGVPFSFVRVDRAGNLSKRQSATGFHFSRAGGTCPLWNVYEAFADPGRIHVQIAEMPDGQRYLWTARAITGTAAAGANPARPSPSVSAARSVTPTASSTPTASTCPAPPPLPPSAWAAASANASTAPSAPHRHSASSCGSTRTPARSSRIQ